MNVGFEVGDLVKVGDKLGEDNRGSVVALWKEEEYYYARLLLPTNTFAPYKITTFRSNADFADWCVVTQNDVGVWVQKIAVFYPIKKRPKFTTAEFCMIMLDVEHLRRKYRDGFSLGLGDEGRMIMLMEGFSPIPINSAMVSNPFAVSEFHFSIHGTREDLMKLISKGNINAASVKFTAGEYGDFVEVRE